MAKGNEWYAVRYKDVRTNGEWHWAEKWNTKGPGLYKSAGNARAAHHRKFDKDRYIQLEAQVVRVNLEIVG
jgi:hypothetical protein